MKYNWQEWKLQKEGFSAYDPENDDPADNPDYEEDSYDIPNQGDVLYRTYQMRRYPLPDMEKILQSIEDGMMDQVEWQKLMQMYGISPEKLMLYQIFDSPDRSDQRAKTIRRRLKALAPTHRAFDPNLAAQKSMDKPKRGVRKIKWA